MSERFRVVHLSDLHFSHGALRNNAHAHSVDHLLGIQGQLQGCDYDLLVVSGDLSNRGDPESLNQAKQWLLFDYPTSDDRMMGLRCDPEKLIVVPGNHDAYNCVESGHKVVLARQKSLENWNRIFPKQTFFPGDEDCRYYWKSRKGEGLFIVAVDSSYFGDPEIEGIPEIKKQAVSAFSQISRGEIALGQTQRLLRWFDMGMSGELLAAPDGNEYIAAASFSKAFKILVSHHYFLEPPGHSLSFSLRLRDRKRVLRNLAMADFDMVLCGHKHVPDFQPLAYSEFFPDRRTKGRYLWNLFRRLVRIDSLPDQFSEEGLSITRRCSAWFALLLRKTPRMKGETDDAYFERLSRALKELLVEPASWRTTLEGFLGDMGEEDEGWVSVAEASEIVDQLLHSLRKEERQRLSREAEKMIGVIKSLAKRPVVQGMCGSSAKNFVVQQKDRSFSVFDIALEDGRCEVTQQEYRWQAGGSGYAAPFERKQIFESSRRVPF